MRVRFVYSAFFSLVAAAACFSACDVQQGTTSSVSSDLDTTRDYAARGPIWATAKNMRGRLDGATPINIQVHLEMHDVASAQAELAAISDPDNARYGQYLTSDAFAAKYGPTKEDVFTVRAYLEHNGLTVTEIPSNSAYIAATGTSAQVEHAFTTQMMSYETPDGMLHAPVAQALLPKTIAPYVHAVLGLASVGHARSPGQAREQATPIVTPVVPADCSHYYGENTTNADPPYGDYVYPFPTAPCSGISPAAMRHAYGIDELLDAGIDGHGQTIAFVDATLSPTLLADAQEYAQRNDPAYPLKTSQFTQVWGPGATQPTETYWYKEEGLDLEAIHAIAPKAKIVYVAAQSDADDDMVSALNLIVSENLASVVSNSWSDYWDEVGTSAALKQAYEQLAIQAGLKGIGLYFASGDAGDETVYDGAPSPCFPDILPEVTTVGGTSLALDSAGAPLFEVGWETGLATRATPDGGTSADWEPGAPGQFASGSGGGTSNNFYPQPTYQAGIVPASLASINGGLNRVIPDVAMSGDPYASGLLVGETKNGAYSEFFEGGTSLSTPMFTSLVALVQEATHRTIGQGNPLFYKASRLGAFRDIRPSSTDHAMDLAGASFETGDLWLFDYRGPGNTLASAPGFDNVTGLGAPRGGALFVFLIGLTMHITH